MAGQEVNLKAMCLTLLIYLSYLPEIMFVLPQIYPEKQWISLSLYGRKIVALSIVYIMYSVTHSPPPSNSHSCYTSLSACTYHFTPLCLHTHLSFETCKNTTGFSWDMKKHWKYWLLLFWPGKTLRMFVIDI